MFRNVKHVSEVSLDSELYSVETGCVHSTDAVVTGLGLPVLWRNIRFEFDELPDQYDKRHGGSYRLENHSRKVRSSSTELVCMLSCYDLP